MSARRPSGCASGRSLQFAANAPSAEPEPHPASVSPDGLSLEVGAKRAARERGLTVPSTGALMPDVPAEGGAFAAEVALRWHGVASSSLRHLARDCCGKLEFQYHILPGLGAGNNLCMLDGHTT